MISNHYYVRTNAWLLLAFLVPTSLFFYNRIENTTFVIEEIDDSRRYNYRRLSVAWNYPFLFRCLSLQEAAKAGDIVTPKFGRKTFSSRWDSLFNFSFRILISFTIPQSNASNLTMKSDDTRTIIIIEE